MPGSQAPIPRDGESFLSDTDSILGTVFEAMAEGIVVQNQAGVILGSVPRFV